VVTSQTLWDQIYSLGRRLESASAALLARVLAELVIGLDQTGWPRLDGKGETPWQMWCLTSPGVVVHRIRDDKSANTFKSLIGNYRGVIVCDALATHGAGARGNDGIALAGCWAHVYRKFEEAAPDHPEARLALKSIGKLHDIDERAEGDLARKTELRRTESAAVIALMKSWLWSQASLKTLSIGNAAADVVAKWDRLTRFLQDARIPLDNNARERAIREPVVGRKNHYGSKSRGGTEIAAILYTLLETAKLRGVDPAAYLRDAVVAAARGEVLLPEDAPARGDVDACRLVCKQCHDQNRPRYVHERRPEPLPTARSLSAPQGVGGFCAFSAASSFASSSSTCFLSSSARISPSARRASPRFIALLSNSMQMRHMALT
jgi:transposase